MIKDADEAIKEYGNLITWDDIKKARESERGVREWSELHQRSVQRFVENLGPSMGSFMGMIERNDSLPQGMEEFEWEDVMSLGYVCWQLMRSANWYDEDGDTMEGFMIFNGIVSRFGMVNMDYTMWCFNSLQFFTPVPEQGFDKATKEDMIRISKELFEEHCGAIKDWLKKETKLNDLWGSLLDLTMADVELQTGEKELLKIAADIWGVPNDL